MAHELEVWQDGALVNTTTVETTPAEDNEQALSDSVDAAKQGIRDLMTRSRAVKQSNPTTIAQARQQINELGDIQINLERAVLNLIRLSRGDFATGAE